MQEKSKKTLKNRPKKYSLDARAQIEQDSKEMEQELSEKVSLLAEEMLKNPCREYLEKKNKNKL